VEKMAPAPNDHGNRFVPSISAEHSTQTRNTGGGPGILDPSHRYKSAVDRDVELIIAGRLKMKSLLFEQWNAKENRPILPEEVRQLMIKQLEYEILYYQHRQNNHEVDGFQREVAKAVVPLLKEMLEHERGPPKKMPLTTKPSRETAPKSRGKGAVKPRSKTSTKRHADAKQPDLTNQGTIAEAVARRQAEERLLTGLRERIANDPRVKNIEELRRTLELKEGQFELLLRDAENPGGRYVTDVEIQRGWTEIVKLRHGIAKHRDELERELNVSDVVWPDGPDRTSPLMVRAVEVGLRRRLKTIAQKYSKANNFNPKDVPQDIGTIYGGMRQLELLGAGDKIPPEVTAVIEHLVEISSKEAETKLDRLLTRIEQDSASVTEQDFQALQDAMGIIRGDQLIGRVNEPLETKLGKAWEAYEKRKASK
jgi:hypothetical protein